MVYTFVRVTGLVSRRWRCDVVSASLWKKVLSISSPTRRYLLWHRRWVHHGLVLDLPNSCIGVLTCIGALGCLVLLFPSTVVPAARYKVCDKVVIGFMIS